MEITKIVKYDPKTSILIPIYTSRIKAGFPSPADDYQEESLDLNHYLIQNPSSTYLIWVDGDSMIDAHILSGDLLIVDNSIEVKHNDIVVASVNNEFTVKRYVSENNKTYLVAENEKYPRIEVTENIELCVWGVVRSAVHIFKGK